MIDARFTHDLEFRANEKNISVAADYSGKRARAMPYAPLPPNAMYPDIYG